MGFWLELKGVLARAKLWGSFFADHDVDYGTEKIFDFGHYFAIRHLVVTAERTVDTLLRTVREHAVDKFREGSTRAIPRQKPKRD